MITYIPQCPIMKWALQLESGRERLVWKCFCNLLHLDKDLLKHISFKLYHRCYKLRGIRGQMKKIEHHNRHKQIMISSLTPKASKIVGLITLSTTLVTFMSLVYISRGHSFVPLQVQAPLSLMIYWYIVLLPNTRQ